MHGNPPSLTLLNSNGVSENVFDIPLGTVRRLGLFGKDTYDTKRK